jgi:hypothetical protein
MTTFGSYAAKAAIGLEKLPNPYLPYEALNPLGFWSGAATDFSSQPSVRIQQRLLYVTTKW